MADAGEDIGEYSTEYIKSKLPPNTGGKPHAFFYCYEGRQARTGAKPKKGAAAEGPAAGPPKPQAFFAVRWMPMKGKDEVKKK
mmetsp:Transcript_56909/g.133722  ORF Transcript_56909/g.133722 Transcript_56909/m.133722 type:complete len:83 (+) Transcript_56909:58-306(+)